MSLSTQIGFVNESAYGTPMTPTRFFEVNNVPVFEEDRGRTESGAVRAGDFDLRDGRSVPFMKGATLPIEMDVPTKGFGWWLQHMLGGTVATSGPVDGNYTHTATVGTLLGKSFTAQPGLAFHPSGTLQPFTGHGGKLTSWELAIDVEGLLVFTADADFEDVDTSTALATFSPASSATVFAWTGTTVTFGAVQKELKNFRVSRNQNLKTDRHYLRGSSLKKEPTQDGRRSLEWEGDMDFVDLTEYNRFASTTQAGMNAEIVATFDGPIAHAGTTLPRLQVTIPVARFDKVSPSADGDFGGMGQGVSGVGRMPAGGGSAITISYRTSDVTP